MSSKIIFQSRITNHRLQLSNSQTSFPPLFCCTLGSMSVNRDKGSPTASVSIEDLGHFTVRTGLNLREALRREGLYLDGTCADQGVCGRCVVRVIEGGIEVPSTDEARILGDERATRGERLACRVTVTGNLKLSVEPERILEIEKTGRWKETWDSPLWNPDSYPMTGTGYGVALDLGTSSFAAALYDLEKGRPLDIRSGVNPQMPWGDEVISRLGAAREDPETAARLRDVVWEKVRQMIRSLCLRNGVSPGKVSSVAVVANSAIHHLALGLPVASLLVPPYVPFEPEARDLRADCDPVGLDVARDARVYFPPLVGGYAGSDALVSLLATARIGISRGVVLDVGTNTEIALWDKDRYMVATAPSGPAFEGGRIRNGMRAEEGAIWKVALRDETVDIEVIGGGPPKGICGTGIVDALAQLLGKGVLEPSGLLKKGIHPGVKERGLVLSEDPEVILRPEDVAVVQEAKAAVAATFKVLLSRMNMGAGELGQVYLAGAFGSRLNVDSAMAIGLLPPLKKERFVSAGNMALIGGSYILLSEEARQAGVDLAGKITHLSMAEDERFEELFLENLYFPE